MKKLLTLMAVCIFTFSYNVQAATDYLIGDENVRLSLPGGVTCSGAATFSGATTLSGAVTQSGAATLSGGATLSGTNTLSGATTISGATTLSGATITTSGRTIYTVGSGADNSAIVAGGGTSGSPITSATAANFFEYRVKSTAASGTARANYTRLYVTGGAGGEAIRAFTTVENNTPADAVNGAHISLDFGSTAGNVTGLGTASRNTLHIPNRALAGTTAAIQAEMWADGSSSDLTGTNSFIRFATGGDGTGVAEIDNTGLLFDLSGFTAASGKFIEIDANEPSWGGKTVKIKCKVGATTFYMLGIVP